ncbi:fumarylacetoacetate hydrolase family protein [Amycolatopsis rhabdoformis]|uniref:Fumarylacetoacetate hydrolase family protein n=1 Tax=Amycolatopsis rhabdoformis TaxID=1448059 RepID=A0ABZ1IK80_9PSEU|nr:fumarylacetoacetate hydrolase family protein [Amycolatopsis rhabdoformis]WSE34176.1 fumarylacetoacetate hydrolase family protein [Amycolatopsis rhabdoformis]
MSKPDRSTSDAVKAAAERLLRAEQDQKPTDPVRDLLGTTDVDLAYAVQAAVLERKLTALDRRVAGRKIGLTSAAVQKQFGVFRPDFGVLLDDMVFGDRVELPLDTFLQPRVEGEVAFVLGTDLPAGSTLVDVLRATEFVLPAIEIVDSRIAGWDITITDTVADNASSGAVVLGTTPKKLTDVDLPALGMSLEHAGEPISTGVGAACLGAPANAVAWLADEVARRGAPLRAGEVVLAGAWGPMITVDKPGGYVARFEDIGEVHVTFTGGKDGAR